MDAHLISTPVPEGNDGVTKQNASPGKLSVVGRTPHVEITALIIKVARTDIRNDEIRITHIHK